MLSLQIMNYTIGSTIPETVLAEVTQKLGEITTALEPYLIALTPDERRTLPKMSEKNRPFVKRTLEYYQIAPQFAPPYFNVAALQKDMEVHSQIMAIDRLVRRLADGLEDTAMEAGSESYIHALGYYNSVKQAVKMEVPGAKTIFEDLKQRFV